MWPVDFKKWQEECVKSLNLIILDICSTYFLVQILSVELYFMLRVYPVIYYVTDIIVTAL